MYWSLPTELYKGGYETYRSFLVDKNVKTQLHHCLAIGMYWPDCNENKALVTPTDHIDHIHRQLDIFWKKYSTMKRKQSELENWHVVLTERDIEGRAEMQRLYNEWIKRLDFVFKDMYTIKYKELAERQNDKLERLTGDKITLDHTDYNTSFESYIESQKELAREIYQSLNDRKKIIHFLKHRWTKKN